MKLLVTKAADFPVPSYVDDVTGETINKGTGVYEAGQWYDNVPKEHADALLAAGAASIVERAPCRCMIAKDGTLARHDPSCDLHRGPVIPLYGTLTLRSS